jgi:ATP-dependent Clp protease adapter protein ClpS
VYNPLYGQAGTLIEPCLELSAMSEEKSSTKTATKSRPKRAGKKSPAKKPPQPLPPWKVLLHNDDKNDFLDVVSHVASLCSMNRQDAMLRTLEAHERGLALLLTTHKERAELYKDQFHSVGLTVTIEPV